MDHKIVRKNRIEGEGLIPNESTCVSYARNLVKNGLLLVGGRAELY